MDEQPKPKAGTAEYYRLWRSANHKKYLRWQARYRKLNREKIRTYNTDYKRRQRAAAKGQNGA